MARKLPIGIQGFEKLRSDGFLYVDKTEYIYKLVHNNVPYFLSRPRRFGKSLLLSTLKAYWEGRKDLFHGLAVEKREQDNPEAWQPYPVFFFDFTGKNFQRAGALEELLDGFLRTWEEIYGAQYRDRPLEERFQRILELAHDSCQRRCVVLIDEYDKPLMDLIANPELQSHNKDVFKGFFSSLKNQDEHIHFLFITGVSKFHKVSVFSDLNQLRDISMSLEYSDICGITEKELNENFLPEIEFLADRQKLSKEECIKQLQNTYDGYRFHPEGAKVLNPYSLLNAFSDGEFSSYWFETGTPSFLIERLKKDRFDIRKFTDQTLYASEATLKDYTGESLDPIPLLYQTGYLTISAYDHRRKRFTLSFPNEEMKYGFLESLAPAYVPAATAGHGLDIFTLDEYLEKGELDKVRVFLTALFAGIPYTRESDPFEHDFQSVIYVVFTLLGRFVQCEMHTATGRIDCIVETSRFLYLFEFKRDDTAEAALEQIEEKEYALPFSSDTRQIFKIGVSFDSASRKLVDWKVV